MCTTNTGTQPLIVYQARQYLIPGTRINYCPTTETGLLCNHTSGNMENSVRSLFFLSFQSTLSNSDKTDEEWCRTGIVSQHVQGEPDLSATALSAFVVFY